MEGPAGKNFGRRRRPANFLTHPWGVHPHPIQKPVPTYDSVTYIMIVHHDISKVVNTDFLGKNKKNLSCRVNCWRNFLLVFHPMFNAPEIILSNVFYPLFFRNKPKNKSDHSGYYIAKFSTFSCEMDHLFRSFLQKK